MSYILIASKDDWRNMGKLFARALNAVGVEAKAVAFNSHPFKYENQADIVDADAIRSLAKEAKGFLLMHSRCMIPAEFLKDKFTVIFHGGNPYRYNSDGMNRTFNAMCDASIVQTGDLLELGAINEHWILPPVDLEYITPPPKRKIDPLIIGHFPRDPKVKGSAEIVEICTRLSVDPEVADKFDFRYDDGHVSWADNLQRIANCDIYIDNLCKEHDGRRYGEWANTTLEAAALGRVVITTFESAERYKIEYGSCPLVVAGDAVQLEEQLRNLITGHKNRIHLLQKSTRRWVEEQHSFEPIGERLKKVFEPCL